MRHETELWSSPESYLARHQPDDPTLFFAPHVLRETCQAFQAHFPGLVTYAVKANPARLVLENLVAAGLDTFDVASVPEMQAVRAVLPEARLHYHNPIRSRAEIAAARSLGIASWSVDCPSELNKIGALTSQDEIAVRFKLPVSGAAYDFGAKFGATPQAAEALLREVAARGARPALSFHPGTQCHDPGAWASYIAAAAEIARRAGVEISTLNVGGGFAADRDGQGAPIEAICAAIGAAWQAGFPVRPRLVCEPGRAMVAEAVTLAARVKALRGGAVFLNDGLYGGLAEMRDMPAPGRLRAIGPHGHARSGAPEARIVFGPTCDSVDRLPGNIALPGDLAEGDYLLFAAMGAYAETLSTRFNGYGGHRIVLHAPSGRPGEKV